MDLNIIKEQFNKAYVRALSAQAGYQCSEPEVDRNSEDLIICGHGFTSGNIENPSIAFQLKATSRKKIIKNGVIKFKLEAKNYNDLIKTKVINPRYLAVMLLPDIKDHWIEHGFMASTIRRDCFYLSLAGNSPLTNKKSIVVDVPMKNKLNANSIKELLSLASKRGV